MAPRLRFIVGGNSRRSRWSLALAFGAGLCIFVAVPVQAATDSLDQSQTFISNLENVPQMAQTFTAGTTGQLDRVQLAADTLTGFARVTVQIQTVAGTAPSGTVLGSASFAGALVCCQQFHDFVFTPAVSITAGTHYAIVAKVASGKLTWWDSGGLDAYSGGQLYVFCSGCGGWLTGVRWGMDFAFQTWVVGGSANQAPAVAADNSAISVNEGTAPANTGTYSDPDGDTVAITPSVGTVTKTGTSSGTWSWSQPASDEAASSQTITITADDGQGLNATSAFTVTVAAVGPSAHIGAGSLALAAASVTSSPEGTAVTLNGSATSPAAADNAAGFTYSWTVTKNGTNFGAGTGATFRFTPDDEGTFVATLQATDDGGMTGTTSVTIAGANVPPSAKITGVTQSASLILAHESLTFGGSFFDPGALDTHTVTWNFGDGATGTTNYGPGTSASPSAVHAYGAPGTYVATLTVKDDDGGVGQATTKVTVLTPQDALGLIANNVVANISTLNAGERNSLIAKLNAASASLSRGDTTAANNQLNAFLNELQADLRTGRISSRDAATLTLDAHAVQAALGTYNRFLEWWPLEA